MCVTWLIIHVCDKSRSCLWLIYVTWLVPCGRAGFVCEVRGLAWLIHVCTVTYYSSMWHDSFLCVTRICDMTCTLGKGGARVRSARFSEGRDTRAFGVCVCLICVYIYREQIENHAHVYMHVNRTQLKITHTYTCTWVVVRLEGYSRFWCVCVCVCVMCVCVYREQM